MDTQARQPEVVEPQTQDFTPPEKISEQSSYKFSVDVWQDVKSPLSVAAAVIPERTSNLLPELILSNTRVTDSNPQRQDADVRLSEIINTNKLKHDIRSGITLDQRTALDIQRFIRNELRSGTSPESLAKLLKNVPGPWTVQLAKDAQGMNQFVIAKADAKGVVRDFALVRANDVSVGNNKPETLIQTGARLAERIDVLRENPALLKSYIQGIADFVKRLPEGDARNQFIRGINERLQANPQTKEFEVQLQKDNTNKDASLALVDKSKSGLLGEQNRIEKPLISASKESEDALRRLFATKQTELVDAKKIDAILKKVFSEQTLLQLNTPQKREWALKLLTAKDPKEQLIAARELAGLKINNLKIMDEGGKERNLLISIKGFGKSGSYVHVFSNDDNGVSRIVLRGISRPDGSITQQKARDGRPADFYGDIWKTRVGANSYLTGAQDKLVLTPSKPLVNPVELPPPKEIVPPKTEKQAAPFDVDLAVKGLIDAGVGNIDGLGKDKYSFEAVKRQLQEYSKEQLDQIKQAFKQKHNLDLEKALKETFSGPQLLELQQLLKGNYDSVTVVMTALADLDQYVFGKSSYQLMKVLRDTFAHKTSEEILQMDAQFKERNGGKSMFDVLRERVKNDPVNKEFLETYFKGVDKRQDTDIVKLAIIAADNRDIELFKEAFRHSSPDARKLFKSTYPDELNELTFGSRSNLKVATEILERGHVSVATEIYLHSGFLSATQRGVDAAIDKMTPEQRKSYFAGKAFEQKSSEDIAKLTGVDRENWLYYKLIKEQMKDAPLTYTAWKVARWEDRIKYGKEGSLITKLLEHQGNIYNSFADTIISTSIDNMSEADFKRAQDPLSGKEFRQQVEQALRIVGKSSDAIAQIMKAYDSKIGLIKAEPWTIDPKVTFENSVSRSTLEAIDQKRGYFMPDRAGMLEALLKMSKSEQAQFLQKEPPSKFRTELLDVVNSTWSFTAEDRRAALRILSRLDETKELKADVLDELTILAAKGAKTSEFVKVLEKGFQDPELLSRINKNDLLRKEFVDLLRYSVPYDDYFKYIQPYLETGKLDFKTKATLFDNFSWSHDDVQGILDAVKGATKQDRADIIKNADSILPFLTDEQRKLVVKVARQDGVTKPEDTLRAAILTGKADVVRQTAEAMKPEERILARGAYEKEFGTQLLTDLIRVGKFDAQMATRLFERSKTTEQRFIDVQDEFSTRMGGFSEWFVNQYDGSGSQAYNRMNEVVEALSKAKLLNSDLSEEEQKRLFDGVRNVLENWRQSRNAGAEVVADLVIMAGSILLALPSGGASLTALAATSVGRAILKTLLKNGATRLATEAAIAAVLRPGIKELIMQEDYDLFSKEGAADAAIGALSLLLMKVGPQELAKITGLFSKPANALSQEFGQAAIRTGDKIAEEFIRRAGLSTERAITDLSQRSLPAVYKASEKVFEQEVRQFLIKSLVDGGKLSAKELTEKLASSPAFRKLVEDHINTRISHLGKEAILKGIPLEKFTAKYLADPRFIRELEIMVEGGLKEALKDLSKLSLIGQRQLLQTSTGALTGGVDGLARGVMQWDRSLSPEENIHNILLQTSTATVLGGVFTTALTAPGNIYKAARTGDKVPLRQIPFNRVEPESQKLIPDSQKMMPERDVSTPDRFEILKRSLDAKQARRVETIKGNLTAEQANVLSKEHIDILAQNYSKVPKDIINKISPDDLIALVKATQALQKDLVLHSSEYTAVLIKHPKLSSWILEHASVLKPEQIHSVLRNWEKLTDAQRALPPDQLMAEVRKLYPKAEAFVPQRRLRIEGDLIINESAPLTPHFKSEKLGDSDQVQEVTFGKHKIRFQGYEGNWQIPMHKSNKSDGGPIKLHIIVNSVEDFKNVYTVLFPHLTKGAELDNLLLGWKSIDPRFAIHGDDWADMVVRRRLDVQKDLETFAQLPEDLIRKGVIIPNGIKQGGKGFTIYLEEGQDFRAVVNKLDQILVKSGAELKRSIPAEQASVDLVVGASKRIGIARQQWRLGQFGPNAVDKGAVLEDAVVAAIKRRYNLASDVSLTDDILRKFESEVGILPKSLVYSQDGRHLLMELSRRSFKEIREVSSGNWAYVDESKAVNRHGLVDRPALYALYRKLNLEPSDLIETTARPPAMPLRGRVDGVEGYTHEQSGVYKPTIEIPTPEKLAQYRLLYTSLQESSLESLFRNLDVPFEQVGALAASMRKYHVKIVEARNLLRAAEEKLKAEGKFPPLVASKEYLEMQALKEEYSQAKAVMAQQALQFNAFRRSTEKQLLTAFEAWANERGGIPPLSIHIFKGVRQKDVPVRTNGWYGTGRGRMAFNENNFVNYYGRDAELAKLALHEHVHLEQDALIIRYSLKAARKELGFQKSDILSGAELEQFLAKANKKYSNMMGHSVNRNWLEHVLRFDKKLADISPEQESHAILLAQKNKTYRLVHKDFDSWMNSARTIDNHLKHLSKSEQYQFEVNVLLKSLVDGTESVDAATFSKRIFGDAPIPPEILAAAQRFKELGGDVYKIADDPKIPYEQLRTILVNKFENRLAHLNDEIKDSWEGYSRHLLELEATGLEHQVEVYTKLKQEEEIARLLGRK